MTNDYIRFTVQSLFVMFCFFAFNIAIAQQKIYENYEKKSFDQLKKSGNFKTAGGCYDYSFAIVKNPSGSGKVLKTTQIGNKPSYCNKNSKKKHRTELYIKPKDKFGYKEPMWVSWKAMVSKNTPTNKGIIVSQVISGSEPNILFQIGKNKWLVIVHATKKKYNLGSVKKNEWVNWKMHVFRSTGNDGRLQVWKNNKLVVNYKGKTTRKSNTRSDFKYGVYWGTQNRGNKNYTMYFDNTRTSTKNIPKVAKIEPNDTTAQAQNLSITIPFDAEDTVNTITDPADNYAFILDSETNTHIELNPSNPAVPLSSLNASLNCDSFTVPIVSKANPNGKFASISAIIPGGVNCVVAVNARDGLGDLHYVLNVR